MRTNTFIFLLFIFVFPLLVNAQQWNSKAEINNHYSSAIRNLQQEIEEAQRKKEYALSLPEKEPDGRTNRKRLDILTESAVIISANQQRIKELENQRSSQLDIYKQQQQQKKAQEAAQKKQAAQAKAAAEKAKNDARKAGNDAKKAEADAERAQKKAEYDAEMDEWREKQRVAREEDERRRRALGDAAAAEAAVKGQIKSQNRMNNLMEGHEEHEFNIEQTNPNKMMSEQRQSLGGDYSRTRMASHSYRNSNGVKQPQMSKILGKVKSTQGDKQNLDELEKQLKELSDFLDQR